MRVVTLVTVPASMEKVVSLVSFFGTGGDAMCAEVAQVILC